MYESIFKILNRVKQQIIQQYNQKGLKASGSFERNITIGRQGRYKVILTLPSYAPYITKFKNQKGRGPGKFPPVSVIEQWIKDKGIKLRDFKTGRFKRVTPTTIKQAGYLIGKKIAEKGTDIYQGKRQPIDLDEILDGALDYQGEELADRIIAQIKI